MATTITVVCPNCSNKMRASSDYIGRQGRCPSCKSLVEITAPSFADPSLATTYPVPGEKEPEPIKASSSTEAPGWLAGLIGVAATALLYFVVFLPLKSTMVGQLFLDRGPIPYVVVLVTCWGLSMLVLKFVAVKKQQSYVNLELELIPLEIGLQITPDNVDQFLSHLEKAPPSQRNSIVGRRIHGALDHFKSRNSVPEVQQYLSTQAEIDASSVDAGYTVLRVFIWAVPILGFIGTVMGISGAVSELSSSLGGGGEIGEKLKEALGGVTSGLATAFDTTLVALTMAIVLLFPTESLRKSEYHMLDRIEGFANEQLLRRMSDEREALDMEQLPDVVKDSLRGAFQEHQRWLAQWQAQVSELGRVVGSDFEQAVAKIQGQLSEDEVSRLDRVQQSSQMLGEIFEKMVASTQTWQRVEDQFGAATQRLLEATKHFEATVAQHSGSATSESPELGSTMLSLQSEIGRLVHTLEQQGGETIHEASSFSPQEPTEIKPVDLEPEDIQSPHGSDGSGKRFGFGKRRKR